MAKRKQAPAPVLRLVTMIGVHPVIVYGTASRQIYHELILNEIPLARASYRIPYDRMSPADLAPSGEISNLLETIELALKITADRTTIRQDVH